MRSTVLSVFFTFCFSQAFADQWIFSNCKLGQIWIRSAGIHQREDDANLAWCLSTHVLPPDECQKRWGKSHWAEEYKKRHVFAKNYFATHELNTVVVKLTFDTDRARSLRSLEVSGNAPVIQNKNPFFFSHDPNEDSPLQYQGTQYTGINCSPKTEFDPEWHKCSWWETYNLPAGLPISADHRGYKYADNPSFSATVYTTGPGVYWGVLKFETEKVQVLCDVQYGSMNGNPSENLLPKF